jgi:hypothetical protein
MDQKINESSELSFQDFSKLDLKELMISILGTEYQFS